MHLVSETMLHCTSCRPLSAQCVMCQRKALRAASREADRYRVPGNACDRQTVEPSGSQHRGNVAIPITTNHQKSANPSQSGSFRGLSPKSRTTLCGDIVEPLRKQYGNESNENVLASSDGDGEDDSDNDVDNSTVGNNDDDTWHTDEELDFEKIESPTSLPNQQSNLTASLKRIPASDLRTTTQSAHEQDEDDVNVATDGPTITAADSENHASAQSRVRRHMASELPVPLRRALLWERQKNTTVNMFRKREARDAANSQSTGPAPPPRQTISGQNMSKSRELKFNFPDEYLNIARGYHARGW